MGLRPRSGISLCAGGGGLDLGVMLAEPDFACRCFVEYEPAAQAVLLGNMAPVATAMDVARSAAICGGPLGDMPPSLVPALRHTGPFHEAAVWPDLRTFVGDGWRGYIDLVSAGYPCQPFSAAGKRSGSDDPRHLWPDVARVLWETGAEWGFFENVAGHISLGLEAVLRDLWDMGYIPAVGLFSSQETGNSHERQRVFIVAHRQRSDRRREHKPQGAGRGRAGPTGSGGSDGGAALENARRAERRAGAAYGNDDHGKEAERNQGASRSGKSSATLGNPEGNGRGEGRAEHGLRGGRDTPASTSRTMAVASVAGLQGQQPGQRNAQGRQDPSGPLGLCGRTGVSPPGPSDHAAWGHILTMAPDLAPSLALRDLISRANDLAAMVAEGVVAEAQAQSDLRRMADALAQRPRALRLLGNGVDPLVAGYAWRTLSSAHGLKPLDLATA